jgi:hypothetical protein
MLRRPVPDPAPGSTNDTRQPNATLRARMTGLPTHRPEPHRDPLRPARQRPRLDLGTGHDSTLGTGHDSTLGTGHDSTLGTGGPVLGSGRHTQIRTPAPKAL